MPITTTFNYREQFVIFDAVGTAFTPDPLSLKVVDAVILSTTLSYDKSKDTGDIGSVAHRVDFNVSRGFTCSDSFDMVESIDYKLLRPNQGVIAGTDFASDPPIKIYATGLVVPTLVSFSGDGASTIQLRKPKWGDKDDYDAFRIRTESRGRRLIVYQDPMWPTTEIFELAFEWLLRSQSLSLLVFLQATVGKLITYHDHLGRSWNGFILNPDSAIEQTGKKNNVITIKFQIIL